MSKTAARTNKKAATKKAAPAPSPGVLTEDQIRTVRASFREELRARIAKGLEYPNHEQYPDDAMSHLMDYVDRADALLSAAMALAESGDDSAGTYLASMKPLFDRGLTETQRLQVTVEALAEVLEPTVAERRAELAEVGR